MSYDFKEDSICVSYKNIKHLQLHSIFFSEWSKNEYEVKIFQSYFISHSIMECTS